MDLLSGDQEIQDGVPRSRISGKLHWPDVRRRVLSALVGVSQMCEDRAAALVRKWSLPTSNAISRSPIFLLVESSAVTNAISCPSGFHAKCCTALGALAGASNPQAASPGYRRSRTQTLSVERSRGWLGAEN